MWWLIPVSYMLVALGVFRQTFLSTWDDFQRDVHSRSYGYRKLSSWDRDLLKIKHSVIMKPVLLSLGWIFVLLYLGAKKLLFPRGVRTRFDQEQEAKERAAEAEAELEKARALLKKEGIIF